ncbi:hypothetical protein [Burkholderia pseudomallei]|uniref:hypothetical protein n=4 Tax=Burkholderia pseudomallei TaxID=28450 RepID=UPI00138AB053|nr:hypothetical protein [Burkholderia pseudomallei]MDA5593661.1 hypothetical protein [Burkholderia pseudomallei]UZU19297.1 hypothetical protein OSB53_28130 [Burkholderia pseudomallei]UZU21717.1 hypothetical protein OSB35_02250 [Burkholderia pseudomallei]UZU27638.1 hypothetical protein OSB54_02245 [Burkholderia pseudomallei]WCE23926.1 hypothetical protein PL318_20830 [Burkholderia pseudomallei]
MSAASAARVSASIAFERTPGSFCEPTSDAAALPKRRTGATPGHRDGRIDERRLPYWKFVEALALQRAADLAHVRLDAQHPEHGGHCNFEITSAAHLRIFKIPGAFATSWAVSLPPLPCLSNQLREDRSRREHDLACSNRNLGGIAESRDRPSRRGAEFAIAAAMAGTARHRATSRFTSSVSRVSSLKRKPVCSPNTHLVASATRARNVGRRHRFRQARRTFAMHESRAAKSTRRFFR